MGINLGDVIHDESRIYGDGINIAARLEALAEPGGVLVSSTVYDQIRGKLPLTFDDVGERQVSPS
jgi:adenylate cyclase